jgi:hypothetical protein
MNKYKISSLCAVNLLQNAWICMYTFMSVETAECSQESFCCHHSMSQNFLFNFGVVGGAIIK